MMDADRCEACGAALDDSNRLDVYGDGETLVCSTECRHMMRIRDMNLEADKRISEREL